MYLTRERLVEIEHELRELKTNGRKSVAQKIADARGHGDLSENAEYDAAKEEQQHLEMKIARLETTLSHAKIIEAKDLPNDKIYILSRVKVMDLKPESTVRIPAGVSGRIEFRGKQDIGNIPDRKGSPGENKGGYRGNQGSCRHVEIQDPRREQVEKNFTEYLL